VAAGVRFAGATMHEWRRKWIAAHHRACVLNVAPEERWSPSRQAVPAVKPMFLQTLSCSPKPHRKDEAGQRPHSRRAVRQPAISPAVEREFRD